MVSVVRLFLVFFIFLLTSIQGWAAYTVCTDNATPTKWWFTGTSTDGNNRLSDLMDDDANPQVNCTGANVAWSNFMTEHIADGIYQIHLLLEIGDGSTSTTLTSEDEAVWFDDNVRWFVKASATLSLGSLSGSWGTKGSFWSSNVSAATNILDGGTMNVYASIIKNRSTSLNRFSTGSLTIKNSILTGESAGGAYFEVNNGMTTVHLQDVFINSSKGLNTELTPDTIENIHCHAGYYGIVHNAAGTVNATDVRLTNNSNQDVRLVAASSTLNLINPIETMSQSEIRIDQSTGTVQEQYTFNIKAADKDGTAIQSVTFTLDGSDSSDYDTEQFSVTTATDGTIAEQTVTRKKWVGTSETETDYDDHRLTRSKNGYATVPIEAITLGGAKDWRFELQPAVKQDIWGKLYHAYHVDLPMIPF